MQNLKIWKQKICIKKYIKIESIVNSKIENAKIKNVKSKIRDWASVILQHITPIMKQLHWLPKNQRIIYKVALITYKALNGLAPHIRNMLNYPISSVNLRSLSKGLLVVPRVRLVNYGEGSFSYAAPKLWNEIPEYIRKSETLSIFKTRLETYLFRHYYD